MNDSHTLRVRGEDHLEKKKKKNKGIYRSLPQRLEMKPNGADDYLYMIIIHALNSLIPWQ